MSKSLEGRVAIVTGAGGGIGRATALELARLGAAVVVNDIGVAPDGTPSAEAVAEAIRAEGGRAASNTDSVTDFEGAGRIADAARGLGGIDILVNNAGISSNDTFLELDPESYRRVVSTHVDGTFNCTRHVAPHMVEQGFGRIVNLVSRSGIIGMPMTLSYAVGKGGVFGFTNAGSRDLIGTGVTMNAVNPSSTETPMVTGALEGLASKGEAGRKRAESLRDQMQKPEQVAVVIASLCTPAAGGINGQIFLVNHEHVGLFQPLTVTQEVSRDEPWNADDLAAALSGLEHHDLTDAYG